ncbi:MAG: hypothetical protein E7167_00295 [Firmicutes bacterium]|nr:hypothetical protein [Bacillota bacterium]
MSKPYKVSCYVLATIIAILTAALILYLQKTFTVTFDTKGGTIYQAVEVRPNTEVMKPSDPIMEGYIFDGWYVGTTDTEFDFNTKIIDDITITAKWKSIV